MCGSYQKYIKTIVIKVKTFKTFAMSRSVSFFLCYAYYSIEGQVTWPIRIKIFKSRYYKPSMETKFPRISPPVHLCL